MERFIIAIESMVLCKSQLETSNEKKASRQLCAAFSKCIPLFMPTLPPHTPTPEHGYLQFTLKMNNKEKSSAISVLWLSLVLSNVFMLKIPRLYKISS